MNYQLTEDIFESGNKPDQATYCSPWLVATLKPGILQFRQGTLTEAFTNKIAADVIQYIGTGG